MSEKPQTLATRLLRYLLGWRIGLFVGGVVIAMAAIAIGFEVSASGMFWSAFAALAGLIPLLMIFARAALLAEDRHRKTVARMATVESGLSSEAGAAGDTRVRLDTLDKIVSDAVRNPYEPTTLPFPAPRPGSRPILLLPSASYHLAEIMPLADALNRKGLETIVAVGEAHWPRIAAGLAWDNTPVYALPEPPDAVEGMAAVVTMKDWAGYGEVVAAAKTAGIPTFAKVEGAQDFADVDTPYARTAYRSADHILCQGRNDYDALDGSRHIVGSSRLERLFYAPSLPIDADNVIINLNFTYGVLEEERGRWIDSAVAACERLRVPYSVALHPAERRRPGIPRASTVPISALLLRASVLVSRFSTVPFEAMARGIPFVYHNPHGEGVATFANAADAFRTTTDVASLASAIDETREWRSNYREICTDFFAAQVDIDPQRSSAERGAAIVAGLVQGS